MLQQVSASPYIHTIEQQYVIISARNSCITEIYALQFLKFALQHFVYVN